MHKALFFLVLLLLFFTQTFFQCGECDPDVWFYRVTELKTVHLNRQPIQTFPITPGAPGSLEYYGIRLFIESELQHPEDTLKVGCGGAFQEISPSFTDCKIFTVNGINAEYPAGAFVSALFRYAVHNASQERYFPVADAAPALTQPTSTGFDFDMIQPAPAEGWYQFEIQLLRGDSSALSVTTDSIYLQ